MICLICKKAEPTAGFAKVALERGEVYIEITNVPSLICPECGEAYTDESIAANILALAASLESEGCRYEIREYHPGLAENAR